MSDADEILDFGVSLPTAVFRVSKSRYPAMEAPPLVVQGAGRFDDVQDKPREGAEGFGVLYCGESAAASFMEILGTLREQPATLADIPQSTMMDVEEREMTNQLFERARTVVSDRWQSEWVLTSAKVKVGGPVFDLSNPGAVQLVRERLWLTLHAIGMSDLDFSHVLSDNRGLTRAISRWIWTMTNDAGDALFSGIRYRSRFDPECICLALYESRYTVDGDIDIQPITADTPGFAEAASTLRLEIR